MLSLKELVELVNTVHNKISDGKTRELFLPLQEKVLEVQKVQLEIEKRHSEEVLRLNAIIDELQQNSSKPKFKLAHSIYWDDDLNPHCLTCGKALFTTENPKYGYCNSCDIAVDYKINGEILTLEELRDSLR